MTEFVGPFELILNTERVIQLENDGDRHDSRKFLERVKNLTILVSNYFYYLNVSNQWNILYNHWNGMANGKVPCDNCDGKQYYPDFPHSCDKANTNKAKEERAYRRGGNGRCDGRGSRLKGGKNKWSNDNKDGDRNDDVNGVQKRGNDWMCY